MKKKMKIYKNTNGSLQIMIPAYICYDLELNKENYLEFETLNNDEIILRKIDKNIDKNIDI